MNVDFHPVKKEVFESPVSADLFQLEAKDHNTYNNNFYLRLSSDCLVCNGKSDYECVSCVCQVCLNKTTSEKRYQCHSCRKSFHEWCRPNKEVVVDNRWFCIKCKEQENKGDPICSSTSNNTADLEPFSNNGKLFATKPSICRSIIEDRRCFPEETEHSIVDRVFRRMISTPPKVFKMNNSGRRSICKLVPKNHFGPIPGVEVGTCWKYRTQVSEAGVHLPIVAGIHGRENEGAYSIVLSGVYADDQDNGEEFYYSGCGGKEKDPKKRLGPQIRDQELTRLNKALALCCDAPIDDINGAQAKNWKAGKPVRVVRNCKLRRFSVYAPEEGFRYDGIYKVVEYRPVFGNKGLKVWRYLLRRDDPTPAPWTEKGRQRIESLNLRMIEPEDDESCRNVEKQEQQIISSKRRKILKPVNAKKSKTEYYKNIDDGTYDVSFISEPYRKAKENSSSVRYNVKSLTTTPDADSDIKPDVSKLSESFAAGFDTSWNKISSDVKSDPDILLDRRMSLRSNPCWEPTVWSVSDIKVESNINRRSIKSEPNWEEEQLPSTYEVASSIFDINEDVKPDINELNAEIRCRMGVMNQNFPDSVPRSEIVHSDQENQSADIAEISSNLKMVSEKNDTQNNEDVRISDGVKEYTSNSSSESTSPGSFKTTFVVPNADCKLVELVKIEAPEVIDMINDDTVGKPVSSDSCVANNEVKSKQESPATSPVRRSEVLELRSRVVEPLKLVISKVSSNMYSAEIPENKAENGNSQMTSVTSSESSPTSNSESDYAINVLPEDTVQLICMDKLNKSMWDYLKTKKTKEEFIKDAKVIFTCPCCYKLLYKPCTTPCGHNVCQECLVQRFKQKTYSCPYCHELLQSDYIKYEYNVLLGRILGTLFSDII